MRETIDRCGDPAMERVMLIILCLYAVALWAIFICRFRTGAAKADARCFCGGKMMRDLGAAETA
jgi:hypothetical protein